jgi:hypothetical protein
MEISELKNWTVKEVIKLMEKYKFPEDTIVQFKSKNQSLNYP